MRKGRLTKELLVCEPRSNGRVAGKQMIDPKISRLISIISITGYTGNWSEKKREKL